MSEGGVSIIGALLVSAVTVRASTVPMVIWAWGSDLVFVAVPVLCSLVAAAAASMDALAPCADIVAASSPKVSASAAANVAATWGSPLIGRVDIIDGDCNE